MRQRRLIQVSSFHVLLRDQEDGLLQPQDGGHDRGHPIREISSALIAFVKTSISDWWPEWTSELLAKP